MRAVVAVLVLALAGCGSTVQQRDLLATGSGSGLTGGTGATGSASGLGDSATGSSATGGPVDAAGGRSTGVAAPDTTGGVSPGTTAGGRPQAAGPAAAGGPRATGRLGPGVTSSKVRIGFQYVDTGSGTGGVIGQDVSVGEPQAQARAVERYINKHGGLGGRTLEVVPYGAPYAGYVNNPQNEYNRICSYYTQDQKVFGVAVYVPDETLIDCLARRDVVTVADGYSMDRQVHERYARHYYAPGSMSQDRGAEVGVEGLTGIGFFKGATIGLLRYDSGVYERADASLRAALGRKGLKIKTTFEISSANTSSATSDVSAAVLRFRADGITHVLVLDNSGGIAYTFMTNAESQGYRPFYGLTTNNSPSALRQLAPAAQLAKASAVSWWWGDVGPEETEATPPALPRSKDLCLKIMKDEGVDLSGRAATGSALITCDQLLFYKALFDRASTPASEALQAAADVLGTAYTSTLSYRTTIGPHRHDGASITRLIRFDSGCGCWRYLKPGPTA